MQKQYRHLFFDLDNTLTRSRTKISPEMKDMLAALGRDIIVVSGAAYSQIQYQVDGFQCFCLGQNGNHAVAHDNALLWEEKLTDTEREEIFAHMQTIPRTWDVPDENDLIEDRGSQICYSFYGHHAPVSVKERFDPDHALRIQILAEHPFESDAVEVKISGTTTLDYFRKGRNKGYNIARLISEKGWNKNDAVYFGDMLFPGGNDESVIGIIDTVIVTDPADTLQKLKDMLY